MISRVTRTGKVLFLGITNRVLGNMTPEALQAESERVERDLLKLRQAVRDLGRRHAGQPFVKSERRCLVSERERIGRELKRRREAAIDQAFDAQDYAEKVEA